jgi:hypothetical protein
MTAYNGIPDWQDPLTMAGQRVLPSFDRDGMYLLLPNGLVLAQQRGAGVPMMLEFVADRNTADPNDSLYTMIDMAFQRESDMAGALRELRATDPSARLQPVTFGPTAYWTLQVPGPDTHTRGLAWENVETVEIHQRLSQQIGLILYNGLKAGKVAALSLVQCELASVMPRLPVSVTFSPKQLLTALFDLSPAAGATSVSVDRMIRFFEGPSLPLQLTGEPSSNKSAFAKAMVGRVRTNYASFVPTPSIADGPHLELRPPDDPALPPSVTWDLRTPLLVPYPVGLSFDPFIIAEQIVKQQGLDAITSFSRIPSFTGMDTLRVFVDSGLARGVELVGVLVVDLTLRIAGASTPHGNAWADTVTLYPETPRSERIRKLTFRDPNAKRYTAELRIITEQFQISGEPKDCADEYLYIGLDDLPAKTLSIAASSDLLEQVASLTVTLLTSASECISLTVLDGSTQAATFLLRDSDEAAYLQVCAKSKSADAETRTLDLPVASTTLGPYAFPSYGPQTVRVSVRFAGQTTAVTYEFEVESSPGTSILATFEPSTAEQEITYFAPDLFRNRFRHRKDSSSVSQAPWSQYHDPTLPLTLDP